MTNVFGDESLGLKLKGYRLVPNEALETKIGVYTLEITQSILSEHPEIIDRWLQKLHREYISKKRSCDFENDPVDCFNLSAYEEFERHFGSWEDGGMIAIVLPHENVIRVSKKPLISIVNEKSTNFVCSKCLATFAELSEFESHLRQENDTKRLEKKDRTEKKNDVPLNPIWWLTQ